MPRPVLALWIAVVVTLVLGLAGMMQNSGEGEVGVPVHPLLKTVPVELTNMRGL